MIIQTMLLDCLAGCSGGTSGLPGDTAKATEAATAVGGETTAGQDSAPATEMPYFPVYLISK